MTTMAFSEKGLPAGKVSSVQTQKIIVGKVAQGKIVFKLHFGKATQTPGESACQPL